MLIFTDKQLAFLATPKTGSTAIETALRPHADIQFKKRRKHVNAAKFRKQVAPFLSQAFGIEIASIAVMRDPVDQLRSWYKYRARPMRAGDVTSTEGMSFDNFVCDVIADKPPPYARVGSQWQFLTDRDGVQCADYLFQYERMELLLEFLSERFGEDIVPPLQNVSPPKEADLSADVETALRAARTEEFALFDQLNAAGGVLTAN
jgi:hypothetical protein